MIFLCFSNNVPSICFFLCYIMFVILFYCTMFLFQNTKLIFFSIIIIHWQFTPSSNQNHNHLSQHSRRLHPDKIPLYIHIKERYVSKSWLYISVFVGLKLFRMSWESTANRVLTALHSVDKIVVLYNTLYERNEQELSYYFKESYFVGKTVIVITNHDSYTNHLG